MSGSESWIKEDYEVSTDPGRLDMTVVHGFLETAYWSKAIPRETVVRAVAGSLNFGLYGPNGQLGYARVVTDKATFAWICDVFVLEAARGQGLGQWLIACIMGHPALQGLRRWMLATADAHDLYRPFGFEIPVEPERLMARQIKDIYKAGRAGEAASAGRDPTQG
ncbi:GNAT family N-acetyltransferase [Pelagibius sp.]|uniref:GNAT family N-acetyltransferase n=1 Tax=Pelagibius sp. TaxID=1931238 RepID=UPI00262D22C1|nr:GNAT family N-acetyltransferase [Pelagibius sp.]